MDGISRSPAGQTDLIMWLRFPISRYNHFYDSTFFRTDTFENFLLFKTSLSSSHLKVHLNRVPLVSSIRLRDQNMSSVSPIPFSSRYNYHTIFSDICKTRFNHLATRLLLTVTVCVTLAAALASKRHHTAIEYLLVLPLKWVFLYLALLLLIITRKNYLHVNFLGYSNLFTHVNGQLFSLRTVVYQIIHSLSSILTVSYTHLDVYKRQLLQ